MSYFHTVFTVVNPTTRIGFVWIEDSDNWKYEDVVRPDLGEKILYEGYCTREANSILDEWYENYPKR